MKFAVGDWILMAWCIVAALFVQVRLFPPPHSFFCVLSFHFRSRAFGSVCSDACASRWCAEEMGVNGLSRTRMNILLSCRSARMSWTRGSARLWKCCCACSATWPRSGWPIRWHSPFSCSIPSVCLCFSPSFPSIFLLRFSARVFVPYFTGEVVGALFATDASYEKLFNYVLIMAALSLSAAVFAGFRGGFFCYSLARIDRRIRSDLFHSLISQEVKGAFNSI